MEELETRTGRDTRLLALVIVVALAVLLVLARFRFPSTEGRVAPVPQGPLERLVTTGTYGDLATAVRSALQSAQPGVVLVDLEAATDDKPRSETGAVIPTPRIRVVAVRVRNGYAVAQVPAGFRVITASDRTSLTVRNSDPKREIAILSAPERDGIETPVRPAADFAGFAYVAVVEAAIGGATARPVFIGRVDTAFDDRWGGDVLVAGGSIDAPPGALVFQLDGRFIGFAIATRDGERALVPLALLEKIIDAGIVPSGEGR